MKKSDRLLEALRHLGIPEAELQRPCIGVLHPAPASPSAGRAGQAMLRAVELGVQSAGGNPVTLGFPAAKGRGWAGAAGLATRAAEASGDFDGLVLVPEGDAGLCGLLMAAARLGVPTVVFPGLLHRGQFKHLVEACGLMLPGASTALEPAELLGLARRSGWQAVTLVHSGWRFKHIFDPAALANAAALDASLGVSDSALQGLAQVAEEAGLRAVKPRAADKVRAYLRGDFDQAQWHKEGGVCALLQLLWESGAVDGSARWVTRGRLRQVLEDLSLPAKPLSFDLQPGRPPERPGAGKFSSTEGK